MSVSFSLINNIGTITIDRPTKLNALDIATLETIESHVGQAQQNADIYGLIFRSSSTKAFSVGADITELADCSNSQALERARYRQHVFSKISDLDIPTVASMDGYALGGGLELALSCMFRLATPTSLFGVPEINLGLLPGAGGTQRLPKLIGQTRALKMILTGQSIQADEALSIGLIDGIIEDTQIDATKFLSEITEFSTDAIRAIIRSIRASELPLQYGLQIENQQLSIINDTPNAFEGVNAFLEKRKATFNQRR